MPVTATCSRCGFSKGVPETYAGKVVQCPQCRERITVPAMFVMEVAMDELPPAPPPMKTPRKPPARPRPAERPDDDLHFDAPANHPALGGGDADDPADPLECDREDLDAFHAGMKFYRFKFLATTAHHALIIVLIAVVGLVMLMDPIRANGRSVVLSAISGFLTIALGIAISLLGVLGAHALARLPKRLKSVELRSIGVQLQICEYAGALLGLLFPCMTGGLSLLATDPEQSNRGSAAMLGIMTAGAMGLGGLACLIADVRVLGYISRLGERWKNADLIHAYQVGLFMIPLALIGPIGVFLALLAGRAGLSQDIAMLAALVIFAIGTVLSGWMSLNAMQYAATAQTAAEEQKFLLSSSAADPKLGEKTGTKTRARSHQPDA